MVKESLWEQTWKLDDEPVLELSIRRPSLPAETRPLRAIERYYARLARLWRERWERVVYPRACQALMQARETSRPFRLWHASLDYQVTLDSGSLLSLYLDAREQGPGRVYTVRSAETWDLSAGSPLSLPVFLPHELRGRRRLIAHLQTLADQRLQAGESLFFQDVADRVSAHFSAQRFYLTPNGLNIFFPMLALGSAVEGIPVFSLARGDLSPQEAESDPKKSSS